MLYVPYLWGGNSTKTRMHGSAWLSLVWGGDRYSTDSIWNVSRPISKDQLLPGDALNLTSGRDPRRLGHMSLFEAWANAARTVMWVYEETEPRPVHRVVAYDERYQPIRLAGLSGGAWRSSFRVRRRRSEPDAADTEPTVKPTVRPTPRPTVKITAPPTPRPTTQTRPTPTPALTTR